MTVASNPSGIGDDAMTSATGRRPDEWVAILDAQGATSWSHRQMSRWLFDTFGAAPTPLTGWWCQAVTVRYEQARGMRAPGQQPDGSFEVSSTRSIRTGQQHALDAAISLLTADLGAPPASVSRDSPYPKARWKLDNGETILATANPQKNGTTPVTFTHSRIPESTRLADARAALAQVLAKLPSALG